LRPVNTQYECTAFRAGAYCIEPSRLVIQKIQESDLLCDSSVTKGLKNGNFYDYRDAYSSFLPWFTDSDEVKYSSVRKEGLLEIPICSREWLSSSVLRKAIGEKFHNRIMYSVRTTEQDQLWMRERNRILQQRYPLANRPGHINNRLSNNLEGGFLSILKWLVSRFIGKKVLQLDYDCLSAGVFVKCLQEVLKDIEKYGWEKKEIIVPIMASGHVKTMHSTDNIDRILSAVNDEFKDRVVFWTLSEAIKHWLDHVDVTPNSDSITSSLVTTSEKNLL